MESIGLGWGWGGSGGVCSFRSRFVGLLLVPPCVGTMFVDFGGIKGVLRLCRASGLHVHILPSVGGDAVLEAVTLDEAVLFEVFIPTSGDRGRDVWV